MLGLILLLQSLVVAVSGPPTSPEYLPIRVADAYGYFAREGLGVTLRPTRAESGAAEALAQGQVDLAATSLEALLRFGYRTPSPRLVFALTAAPPVALLAAPSAAVAAVADLAGGKVGFATPGSPEHTWLYALLARAGLGPTAVDPVSLGSRGVITALDGGEVQAAFVGEPVATNLVRDGRARLLVALTSPRAVAGALGAQTVNAGVFLRGDRKIGDRELTAFARALLAAERVLATAPAAEVAAKLPRPVIGGPEEFEARLETTRGVYLADGLATADAVGHTIGLIRLQIVLPSALRLPRPADLLHLEPVRRALRSRSPSQ